MYAKKAALKILKAVPTGSPQIPVYEKFPTVADVERGLDQTKTRFPPDEVH